MTPRDHPDRVPLQLALTQLECLAESLRERKREAELRNKVKLLDGLVAQSHKVSWNRSSGSKLVSEQLCTYPSPNPTSTLTCYQLIVVVGGVRWEVAQILTFFQTWNLFEGSRLVWIIQGSRVKGQYLNGEKMPVLSQSVGIFQNQGFELSEFYWSLVSLLLTEDVQDKVGSHQFLPVIMSLLYPNVPNKDQNYLLPGILMIYQLNIRDLAYKTP